MTDGDQARAEEALRELLAKATPGPWRQEFYRDGELLPDGTGGLDDYETPGSNVYVIDQSSDEGYCLTEFDAGRPADAALIVAAVNALPGLLERLERVEALADEWDTHRCPGGCWHGRDLRAALFLSPSPQQPDGHDHSVPGRAS